MSKDDDAKSHDSVQDESLSAFIENVEANQKLSPTSVHTSQLNVAFVIPEKIILNVYNPDKDSIEKLKVTKKKKCMNSRDVLWWMAFIGFAINYMIRMNLNIAVVDMVAQKKTVRNDSSVAVVSTACFHEHKNVSFLVHGNENGSASVLSNEITGKFSFERTFLRSFNFSLQENGFDWNEKQQGMLLGSFYWLHWVTQIPGGILARRYGTKLVFGLSNMIGCLMCSIMPIVSFFDYRILIFFRVLQGLICGLSWPSMHNMTAQWIPPHERSKFVTAYLGSSIGIAVFYPLFGAVISISSWEWVFHLCSVLGGLWYIGWLYFVFDSPQKHPRIDPEEREYILKSLGGSFQNQKRPPTPWKKIFTSMPVWMNVISQFGGIWGLFTLMTQAPTYFKVIHGWDIKMIGLLTGFPHLMRMIFAYIFSLLGDYLLRSNKMSTTNVRKLATFFCSIVKGVFVIGIAYSGCNSTMAVVFLTIATTLHGAVSTGALASVVDISPNFSGVVLGFCGMVGVLPGFISPYIVGYLTLGNQTIEQWKYVFLISAAWLIGSGVLYVLFSDSTEQYWNKFKDEEDEGKQLENMNGYTKIATADADGNNEIDKKKNSLTQ